MGLSLEKMERAESGAMASWDQPQLSRIGHDLDGLHKAKTVSSKLTV